MKRKRIYKCLVGRCSNKAFSSKADLKRHQREVHHQDEDGNFSPSYQCPHSSCVRHERGFKRSSNLRDHLRRVHPNVTYMERTEEHSKASTRACKDSGLSPLPKSSALFSTLDCRPMQERRPESSELGSEELLKLLSTLEKQRENLERKREEMMAKWSYDIEILKSSIDLIKKQNNSVTAY